MILYHGSYTIIRKPDLAFSKLHTDFGKGFYLTPLKEQAVNWAQRFIRDHGTAVVSFFDFLPDTNEKLPPDYRVLEFSVYNNDWLNYITACRMGQSVNADWDLVIGGVANDMVFDTIQLFFEKLINAEEAVGRLKYNKPNLQYCFKTQSLIDKYLSFCGAEVFK